MPGDYLIEQSEGDLHDLRITFTSDRSLIYLSTNSRRVPHTTGSTVGLSPLMAEQIAKGLLALLRGNFDRALSETALRMEVEERERRERRATTPSEPPVAVVRPNLDML